MKSDEVKDLASKTVEELQAIRLGYRRANHAALYAHLRGLIAASLRDKNPVVGLHATIVLESGEVQYTSAGGVPSIDRILGGLGSLQGFMVAQYIAREKGDFKAAKQGDVYNPETGKTHCVGCEDGDPTGEHAKHELEENAKAWLGAVIEVAEKFYGDYLSTDAKEHLRLLKLEALPATSEVS